MTAVVVNKHKRQSESSASTGSDVTRSCHKNDRIPSLDDGAVIDYATGEIVLNERIIGNFFLGFFGMWEEKFKDLGEKETSIFFHLLDFMRFENKTGRNVDDLVQHFGRQKTHIYASLRKLISRGIVSKEGHEYVISEELLWMGRNSKLRAKRRRKSKQSETANA